MRWFVFLMAGFAFLWGLEVGEVASKVVLDKKDGGRVDGKAFDTTTLKGKVVFLIYSDPSKKDLNKELFEKVKEQRFDRSRYSSVAVVNMAATWMPNFVLNAVLKKKQKEYPDTIYVKDKKKVFVKKWGLADKNQNIVVLDKDMRVLFVESGKLDEQKIEQVIDIIREHL